MGKVKQLETDIQYIMNVLSARGEQKAFEAFENVLSTLNYKSDIKIPTGIKDSEGNVLNIDDTIVRDENEIVRTQTPEEHAKYRKELIDEVLKAYYGEEDSAMNKKIPEFVKSQFRLAYLYSLENYELRTLLREAKKSKPDSDGATLIPVPHNSFEYAKRQALNDAKQKMETGKLFKSGDESDESKEFSDGDPETLFSLASLYAQYVDDDFNNACDALLDILQKEFPDYI